MYLVVVLRIEAVIDYDPMSTTEKDVQTNPDQPVMVCNQVVNVQIDIVDEVDEQAMSLI